MPKKSHSIPRGYLKHKKVLAREIGARIRGRRISLKISQESLRAKLELESVYITRSQFSRIEKGERLPQAAEIIALAGSLKVSFSWLLLGKDEGNAR